MRFAHIPKADYKIGQRITVLGQPMVIVSYAHTGRSAIVHTLEGADKFERIVCVCSISYAPIAGIEATEGEMK